MMILIKVYESWIIKKIDNVNLNMVLNFMFVCDAKILQV
jgi:hypothetical protein